MNQSMRRYFKTTQISFSSLKLPSTFSIHWGFLPELIFTRVVAKRWLSNISAHSTFVCWHLAFFCKPFIFFHSIYCHLKFLWIYLIFIGISTFMFTTVSQGGEQYLAHNNYSRVNEWMNEWRERERKLLKKKKKKGPCTRWDNRVN